MWRVYWTKPDDKEWSLACDKDDVETLIRILLLNGAKAINARRLKPDPAYSA
jgi:hypothetical protein